MVFCTFSTVWMFSESMHVCSSVHMCVYVPVGPLAQWVPLPWHSGVKVYVLTSWCKRARYPAPRPSPTASPSARNLCCEEQQQRAAHPTFGKSAWFIFTLSESNAKLHRGFSTQCFLLCATYLFIWAISVFFCPEMKGWGRGGGEEGRLERRDKAKCNDRLH